MSAKGKYELLPPLSEEELAALRADIKANGVRDAVIVDEEGNILDGYNRKKIDPKAPTRVIKGLTEAEKKAFVFQVNFSRRNLSPAHKKEALRLMKAIAKELREEDHKKNTQSVIARRLGVSRTAVEAWLQKKERSSIDKNVNTTTVENSPVPTPAKFDAKVTVPREARPLIYAAVKEDGKTQAQVGANWGISQKQVSNIVKGEGEKLEKAEKRRRDAEEARGLGELGVIVGDWREKQSVVKDNSVDLIFTDPPYDRDTLPQYEDLGKFAARVLKPGGSLITYLGDYQLPEVLDLVLKADGLKFWWPLACIHTGATTQMRQWGVIVGHKLMLWFVKGKARTDKQLVKSCVHSAPEKDAHDWQQGTIEAEYYIRQLTARGGLVVDPYCGGGTTCVAAKTLGRHYMAFEVDEEKALIARKRINDTKEVSDDGDGKDQC